MPKKKTWDAELRSQIKREHGSGLSLREMRGSTQLTIRFEDGSRQTGTIPVTWGVSSASAIQQAVAKILHFMEKDPSVPIGEACQTLFPQRLDDDEKKLSLVLGSEAVDWDAVAETFLSSMGDRRATTYKQKARHVALALETLQSRPKPKDGASLMRAYAKQHFKDCAAGGSGRVTHLNDLAALLRHAIKRHGAPDRWAPLDGEDKTELVGHADYGDKGATIPLKPEQLARLLDELKDAGAKELELAVGLIGLFGLRQAELGLLTVEDGCLYVGGGAKRNLRTMKSGSVKPRRRVLPLDIKGREGHGMRYLRLFESGLVKLPQAIRTQIAKCVDAEGKVIGAMKPIGDEFTQQLTRFKNAEGNHVWKSLQKETKGLTANGLRHGYAFRAHKCGEGMDVFTAANLMGHDAKTHIKHYAQWIDETTLVDRVAQWEGVLVSQPESLTKLQQQTQQQQ